MVAVVTVFGLALLGIAVGPALGIAVDRAVDRLRPAPEHRCAHCEAALGSRSLIPVASWFQRCLACGRHKGWRYPAVDLATAAVFAVLGWRFTAGGGDGAAALDWKLWPFLAAGAVLVVLSVIDIETHLLPNVIVYPSILTSLFAVLVLSGELDGGAGIGASLLGGAIFGGFIGLAHVVYSQGMGFGDVKLALFLGLLVGWLATDLLDAVSLVLYAILLALLGGGLFGLAYNAIRRRGRAEIPFGPALAAGSLAIIVVSPGVVGS